MGNELQKFNNQLRRGKQQKAMRLYRSIQMKGIPLDTSRTYGDTFGNTPLHYAALYHMDTLLQCLLRHHAIPAKRNKSGQTPIHLVCYPTFCKERLSNLGRSRCLELLLRWDRVFSELQPNKTAVDERDNAGNTALHYAACSGLIDSVERLVQHGYSVFTTNVFGHTPYDVAEQKSHAQVAGYLEDKMTAFLEIWRRNSVNERHEIMKANLVENHLGLNLDDVKSMKRHLLQDTTDMISLPQSIVEVLLRDHDWSKQLLSESWFTDPVGCCGRSGLPCIAGYTTPSLNLDRLTSKNSFLSETDNTEWMCEICTVLFDKEEQVALCLDCGHQFCRNCWKLYLHSKIEAGVSQHITCPSHDCRVVVPVEFLLRVVSYEMAERFEQLDLEGFVESNPTLKWCPHPRCRNAVRFCRARQTTARAPVFVHCGKGHYFCWECLDEINDNTCTCGEQWIISMMRLLEDQNSTALRLLNFSTVLEEKRRNRMWLIQNTNDCPRCQVPIEKFDGCNNMTCTRCGHSFQWNTPGLTRDFEVEMNKASEDAIEDVRRRYLSKVKLHEELFQREQELLKKFEDSSTELRRAIRQLLRARRTLICSYAYFGTYVGPENAIRELKACQDRLDEHTKNFSKVLNTSYFVALGISVSASQMLQTLSSTLLMKIWKHQSSCLPSIYEHTSHNDELPGASGFIAASVQDSDGSSIPYTAAESWTTTKNNDTFTDSEFSDINDFRTKIQNYGNIPESPRDEFPGTNIFKTAIKPSGSSLNRCPTKEEESEPTERNRTISDSNLLGAFGLGAIIKPMSSPPDHCPVSGNILENTEKSTLSYSELPGTSGVSSKRTCANSLQDRLFLPIAVSETSIKRDTVTHRDYAGDRDNVTPDLPPLATESRGITEGTITRSVEGRRITIPFPETIGGDNLISDNSGFVVRIQYDSNSGNFFLASVEGRKREERNGTLLNRPGSTNTVIHKSCYGNKEVTNGMKHENTSRNMTVGEKRELKQNSLPSEKPVLMGSSMAELHIDTGLPNVYSIFKVKQKAAERNDAI